MNHVNHDIQHDSALGLTEQLYRWMWALLEFGAAPFSRVLELFWRTNPGRRNFSLPGVFVTYYLILAIFFIGSLLGSLISKPGGWKPTIVIDPLNLRPSHAEPNARTQAASPENFYWSLRLYLVMAISHKIIMQIRRLRKTEPELTIYSGDSRIQFLLAYVPWLKKVSLNEEDACKRFIEPTLSWILAKAVITPFVDPLVGKFYCWCAIAMAIKAHCVRTRHQFEKDDLMDVRIKWQQLFKHLETSRSNASDEVARVSAG